MFLLIPSFAALASLLPIKIPAWLQLISYLSPYLFNLGLLLFIFLEKKILALFVCVLNVVSISNLFNYAGNNKSVKSSIRILSLNCNQLKQGNVDITTLANEISKSNPDIVCFQEFGVKQNWIDKKGVDQYLKNTFIDYPYIVFSREFNNIYGLAILSKFPVIDTEELLLPTSIMNGIVKHSVVIHRDTLSVFNVHLYSFNQPKFSVRNSIKAIKKQHAELESIINNSSSKKTILAGDFNFPAYGFSYNKITANYKDSFYKSNLIFGSTLQNIMLPWRIDYQFYADQLTCVDFNISSTAISDHKLTLGEFSINN